MVETKAVRPGEEIDVERLAAFLSSELGLDTAEIDVEQFPAGSSNLTYLVRVGRTPDAVAESIPPAVAGGAMDHQGYMEYVLRRPPFGNTVKSAHDMHREFDVLSKLSKVYPPAPKPLLFSSDASIIGSEFYLMERREGLIIRGKIPGTYSSEESNSMQKPARSKGSLGPSDQDGKTSDATLTKAKRDLENSHEFRQRVCKSFIQNLADLHSLDPSDAQLDTLGKPDGYNRRQVEGWTKRYFAAKTDEHPELESAIKWLNDNIPPESGALLIHNDYKFDNVMLDPTDLTRVTAVLDWEMVTIGDPLMDLGTTLGYWMSSDAPEWLLNMPFNPRVLMQNITRRELVEMYAKARGHNVPDMLFYYAFGTFKIGVIAQQIFARYVKGFTSDARFAGFDKFVAGLGRIAANAIESKRI